MAVTGFIVSLLGFCCGPLFAILALVFSCIGLTKINRNPAGETGRHFAFAGIAISAVALIIFVILWVTGGLAHLVRNILQTR